MPLRAGFNDKKLWRWDLCLVNRGLRARGWGRGGADTKSMTIGFHSACELVRLRTPFEAAVTALVAELQITEAEATAAMTAAHEHMEWGDRPRLVARRSDVVKGARSRASAQ